ncbi:unnamed protein product [Aphanomyces euteiches]|uniref:N-acetyltransferase domain-containing protein n=1 Tax=Aphanomyces euteiches TaxID=100861 RepID=A0A6G0WE69_9STRA|nr:hypothetical protein Ae201684_016009 [Aphanomyces euteiches]KAH9078545.1 hypothetical protein Ae201684P_019627 [Aphanomyces euteiches]KAH9141252.1 hypothetical protein AeRB84_014569 [Aphanomyces euteiches]
MASSTSPTIIREAVEVDIPLIYDFIHELATYEKLAHEHVGTHDDLRDTLFENKYAHVIIASVDGQDVGFALYFFNYSTFLSRPGLYLEDLYVRPTVRGRGVGTTLMKHLANLALAKGCGRMEWSAINWNTPAINFYVGKTVGATCMKEWDIYRLQGDSLDRFVQQE